MNIERMKELRNALAEGKAFGGRLSFNMSQWMNDGPHHVDGARAWLSTTESCGTTACIAGWACLLFGDGEEKVGGDTGRELLDLDRSQAERLFLNREGYVAKDAWGSGTREHVHQRELAAITLQEAIAAIDRMIQEAQA